MTSNRSRRWLFVLLFVCVLLAYLGYQALVSPEIEFLRPSLSSEWIVHPNPPIIFQQQPACPDGTFRREFILDDVPERLSIRVTAREILVVRLNGIALPVQNRKHWKFAVRYELGSPLRPGKNEIEITVSGRTGPPALLVEAPEFLRTNGQWQVSLGTNASESVPAVRALHGEAQTAGKISPLRNSRWYPLYLGILLTYLVVTLGSLLPVWPRGTCSASEAANPPHRPMLRFWREHGFCVILFAIVVVYHIHNVLTFPHTRSHFDWQGHVDYIRYVAQHWRTPLATEGWEMFQPPLYYFSSALLYRAILHVASEATALKGVQCYTMLIALGNIVLTWAMLYLVFPTNRRARNLGFSVVAMLPMGFYMNSMISNEIFSGGIIGLAIYLAARFACREPLRWRHALVVGSGCGLALLSKYTGLFVTLSVVLVIFLRGRAGRRSWQWGLVFLLTTGVLCGWLYTRNVLHFHDPFIGNWDTASGFHYEQHPGYRNVAFYTRFGSALTHLPEHSRWWSFWDGKYASMWTDTHGTFLNIADTRTQLLTSLSLWLALLPSLAILVGFAKATAHLMSKEWRHPYFILVTTSVLTVVSLLSFTMEVPTYSTIKAFFFLSLLSSLGVFGALGLDTICERFGRLRWLVYLNLTLLYGLIGYLFWYRGT